MTDKQKSHLLVVILINLAIIMLLIGTAWSGNDKAIILVIFLYPVLILLNGAIWLTLRLRKKPGYFIYRVSTILLAALYFPVLIIASLY